MDTSFNSTGEVTVNLGGTDTAYAVAPGPGGTIVAAGVAVISGSNDDALIRLTSTGALDTTFNSTGELLGSSGSGTVRAIVVQTNGEVLAGGDAGSGTAQKVWMFTPSGAADTGFASGGTLTANSGATVYGWAVASGPTQRIVVAGSYGGYEALAAFAPDSVRLYAEQDANYNVTAMVDSNGNVVQRFVYDPYGSMTVLSAAWTPQSDLFDTQVGFQGMWLDAASGLYHTPNRDYSPALGRWVQVDPAGYLDGTSLYQSFLGNPTGFIDPRGTMALVDDAAGGGAVVVVVGLAAVLLAAAAYSSSPAIQTYVNANASSMYNSVSNTAGDAADTAENVAQSVSDAAGPVYQAWGEAAQTTPTADEVAAMNQWIADGIRDLLGFRGALTGGANLPPPTGRLVRPPITADTSSSGSGADLDCNQITEDGDARQAGGDEESQQQQDQGNGSYTNRHESGNTYSGKGDRARMNRSANRIAKKEGDPVVSQDHTPAPDAEQSFIDEQNRIEANGGPGGNTYNQRNSPGKKLRDGP